jgi:hypothetical protein
MTQEQQPITVPSPAALGPDTSVERRAILVLGMHRSGTSALSGLLTQLGCDGPATPMAATAMNPKGYFESDAIYRLHEEIFTSAGTSWDDFRPFPQSWLNSPDSGAFRLRMQDLITSEYGDSRLFVLKDPRICRMLPFWIDLLVDMGIEPIAIHTHRNPIEVSTSLTKRDQIYPDYGQLLWLCHVLEAEHGSRALTRIFTSYENLIENWAGEAQRLSDGLGISWPGFVPGETLEVETFIDPKLRRFNATSGAVLQNELLPKWIRDTYSILQNWAAHAPRMRDSKKLDGIRKQYSAGVNIFGSLILSRGQAIQTDRLNVRRKLMETERTLVDQAQKIDSLTIESGALLAQKTSEISNAQAEICKLSASFTDLEARRVREVRDLTQDCARRDRELAKLSKCIAAYRSEIEEANALRPKLAETRQALMQNHVKINQTVQTLLAMAKRLGIPETGARTTDLTMALAQLQLGVDALQHARTITDEKLRDATAYSHALINSTSWRITAPLRWASLKPRHDNQ